VYDPTGGLGRPGDNWSPLASCEDWEGARKMGQWLTAAGASSQQRSDVTEFFETLGAKYVGPLLFAAANDGRPMRQVLSWVNTGAEKEPAAIRSRSPTSATRSIDRPRSFSDDTQRNRSEYQSVLCSQRPRPSRGRWLPGHLTSWTVADEERFIARTTASRRPMRWCCLPTSRRNRPHPLPMALPAPIVRAG
jgi:hypothetical protein